MARLFVIDQSLCSLGGHHFDYVNCIAKAASHDKHQTLVATNRRFRVGGMKADATTEPLNQIAKVIPGFRNTTYQKVSWLAGLRHLKRTESHEKVASEDSASSRFPFLRLLALQRMRRFRKQRRKIIAQFACDCSRFFTNTQTGEFRRGDQVFLTTVSELELMGLAIYLSTSPSSRNATWHLQFHFNLFEGRPNGFAKQTMVQRKVRGCFLAALSRIPDHALRFYCTSEELVEQYARLKVADFSRLPYPVNEQFAPSVNRARKAKVISIATPVASMHASGLDSNTTEAEEIEVGSAESQTRDQPVRMIVPGELRREKGSVLHLQGVVDDLWEDYLSVGRLQVAVQRPKRKLLRGEKLKLSLPDKRTTVGGHEVIDYLRHPLSEQQYGNFIRESDFGLMLHDSRAYYSRRAGVLGELLSCGKPVIVPAGCWLAHQIQESLFRHVGNVRRELPESRLLDLRTLRFDSANAPLSGGVISFDRQRHPFRAMTSKSKSENIAIVSFNWQHPQSRGVNARIRCKEVRCNGETESAVQVIGHRASPGKCQAIFRLGFSSEQVHFEIENAFADNTASIRDFTVELFCANNHDDVPMGFNGLIYADVASIGKAAAEVVEHLDHYQHNAESFANRWWQAHDPRRTLDAMFDSAVMRKVA